MEPLDSVIWSALTTRLSHLAVRNEHAARLPAEVSLLGAVAEESEAGWRALAAILPAGERVGLFVDVAPSCDAFAVELDLPLLQMVHDDRVVERADLRVERLGPGDAPEMMALVERTKPGPFGPRTHELGAFHGVRSGGALVAMAGERLRVHGHQELSAICTHPDHLGRGLAAGLVAHVTSEIQARNERAFLHVLPTNERAVALYERLGFRTRVRQRYVILRAHRGSV